MTIILDPNDRRDANRCCHPVPTIATAQDTIPFFQPGKIRVLILSGRNNHDWRTTTPFLRKILVDSGRFDVRVEEEPAGITGGDAGCLRCAGDRLRGPALGRSDGKGRRELRQAGQRTGGGPCRQLHLHGSRGPGRQPQALGAQATALARVFADDRRLVDATARPRPPTRRAIASR